MATDYPDYRRSIDISSQDLYQQETRIKYGPGNRWFANGTFPAGFEGVLTSFTGKGTIYGGYFRVTAGSTQRNGQPGLRVDTALLCWLDFYSIQYRNFDRPYTYPVYNRLYDDTNFNYVVCFSPWITYESEVKIEYAENNGAGGNWFVEIVVAKVE